MRILVAGVGNVLQGDDGFGVEVAQRLRDSVLPSEVTVVETGIGGVHLVQELMAGFDGLVLIDAVDRDREPGTVMIISPEVEDPSELNFMQKHDYLADMHYTKPSKALMLATALGVLPPISYLVGCQPSEIESLGQGLSPKVEAAVAIAVEEVKKLVDSMLTGVLP